MMERLCRCLRSLLRMRRSADLVFGIVSFLNQLKGRNTSEMALNVNAEAKSFWPCQADALVGELGLKLLQMVGFGANLTRCQFLRRTKHH